MRERIQNVKNTLDVIVFLGYVRAKPTLDKINEYLDNARALIRYSLTLIRHPLAAHIVRRQERALRYMDSWEREEYEIRQERGQLEY